MKERSDILILDTVGDHLTDAYRALLPDIDLVGHPHPDEPDVSYDVHMHGAWCGFLAGVPLQVQAARHQKRARIDFFPVFRPNATAYTDGIEIALDIIRKVRPRVISRSWGAWDQDDRLVEMFQSTLYSEWIAAYSALQDEIGFIDVAASGNNDQLDADADIAAPQRYMTERSLIIGSANRQGIPSKFSGDGKGGLCLMVGEKVLSPNLDGSWESWNGTSATAPKVAGVAATTRMTRQELRDLVQSTCTYPAGGESQRPHPKWFWGNWEWAWQDFAKHYPQWPANPATVSHIQTHEVF